MLECDSIDSERDCDFPRRSELNAEESWSFSGVDVDILSSIGGEARLGLD